MNLLFLTQIDTLSTLLRALNPDDPTIDIIMQEQAIGVDGEATGLDIVRAIHPYLNSTTTH